MPYTADTVPDYVPEDKAEQWAAAWNSAYESCIEDGGKKKKCESSAFAQANGAVLEEERGMKELLERLWARVQGVFTEALEEASERAISGWDMMDQVYALLNEPGGGLPYAWPVDLFLDGGQLYMVVTSEGKLYRAAISVDEATDMVTLSEWQQIKVEHVPVESRITVHRQADGKYRFVVIANTAVLNRVGEIDSMAMFDRFISRAEETGKYPFVTFYHITRPEEALNLFRLGQCDYLARDEMVYVNSGLLDETAPLGMDVIRSLESNSEIWGTSIGFNPRGAPELVEIGGVKIPVYQDGEHVELSLILEKDAAALFTTVRTEVCRMDERIKKGLEALGLSEERISEFSTIVDGVKDRVRAEGMITRTEEGEAEPEAVAPPEAVTQDENAELVLGDPSDADPVVGETEPEPIVAAEGPEIQVTNLVVDEETLPGLAAGLLETDAFQQVFVPIVDGLKDLGEKLEAAIATLTQAQQEGLEPVRSRLEKLEQTDDEKRQVWEADLPAKRTTINVTYRAPGRGEDEEGAPMSYEARAEETVAAIKKA